MTSVELTRSPGKRGLSAKSLLYWAALALLLAAIFRETWSGLLYQYGRVDSYYSHGLLIPVISLFFVWRMRRELRAIPVAPSGLGLALLAFACFMVLVGDFLGFRLIGQSVILLMVAALVLSFLGIAHLRALWFPIAFLVFMIPIPDSITQSLVLQVKLLATELAVRLAQLVSLPMIRDGSFVIFGNDRLLVGEVCGGLRSLIALLALGAVVSYVSRAKPWARWLLFVLSAPVAIAANVTRIFFLCVVGYNWGSTVAAGRVHDISGVLIYATAAILLVSAEQVLRKIAPLPAEPEVEK
ncbi:MAG: exosortase/archaeosortase family protein [Candidatus Hydrogenedentes bacterium]|nr:exosortase/archaeosortase family protein [Candidatus Hydrogenedentota bacterium]